MASKVKPFVVTLEEHYWDAELLTHFGGRDGNRISAVEQRLQDLGELRLKEMDEAGIDLQVLSHGAPGAQKLPADIAARLARETNDRLYAVTPTAVVALNRAVAIGEADGSCGITDRLPRPRSGRMPSCWCTTAQAVP